MSGDIGELEEILKNAKKLKSNINKNMEENINQNQINEIANIPAASQEISHESTLYSQ